MLPHVKNILADIERFVLPSARKAMRDKDSVRWLEVALYQLATVETLLKTAEDVVRKYGPDFDAVGG